MGTETEVPRYRATRHLRPSPNARHRHEPPLSQIFDSSVWQQSDREIAAGEEISWTGWPHPSMTPLNESARAVLQFFNSAMRSRLPLSPWRGDRLNLDDGLSGPGQPSFTLGSPEGRAA